MRELHISIVYHPREGWSDGTLFDLCYAKRPNYNQNCIICKVLPDVSDDTVLEKVREYFLKEMGRQPHEFELHLGHNELKEMPHREDEQELLIAESRVTKGLNNTTLPLPLQ